MIDLLKLVLYLFYSKQSRHFDCFEGRITIYGKKFSLKNKLDFQLDFGILYDVKMVLHYQEFKE